MNLYQRRQKNLLDLIKSKFDDRRVDFCNKYNIDESRLGQMLSDTYRDGRGFGERAARKLEEKIGLPALYFERVVDEPYSTTTPTRELSVREADDTPTLAYITPEESRLLSHYRVITEDEKNAVWSILETAKHDDSKIKLLKKIMD